MMGKALESTGVGLEYGDFAGGSRARSALAFGMTAARSEWISILRLMMGCRSPAALPA